MKRRIFFCTSLIVLLLVGNYYLASAMSNETSPAAWQTQASPVQVRLDEFRQNEDQGYYELNLFVKGSEQVGYIKVMIWDGKGATVDTLTFKEVHEGENSYKIEAEKFADGQDYRLVISAINSADQTPFVIAQDGQGKPVTELEKDFTHVSVKPAIRLISAGQRGNELILGVVTTNAQKIHGYYGWFEQNESQMQVNGSEFAVPGLDAEGKLRIPIDRQVISSGKYLVVVRALDKTGRLIEPEDKETGQWKIVISFPKTPWWQALWTSLSNQPLLAVLLVVVTIAAGFAVTYVAMRSRREADNSMPAIKGKYKALRKSEVPAVKPVADRMSSGPVPLRPEVTRPLASLVCLRSDGAQALANQRIMLGQLPYLIGRSSSCDLCVPDPLVSGKHVCIDYDAQQRLFMITDLKSTNGTVISSQSARTRLTADDKEILTNGSMIELGPNLSFRFEVGEVYG